MKERPPTLEEGVRRIQEAVSRAVNDKAAELERWVAGETREQRLERERQERRRRRKEKRLDELREKSPAGGGVMIAISIVMVAMVFVGFPWWLVFVALGLAIGGVSQLGTKGEIARLERELGLVPTGAEVTEPPDPARDRLRRVDELAALLARELAEGPEAMRALVARPKETVESIRKGCHALAEREKALRALSREGAERLEGERSALAARRDAETDPVTRERLGAALAAMEEQARQKAELERHANRLEAEQVRLSWTLETLYTQVVKARSTGSGAAPVEDEHVRRELERLTAEVGAVASALEEVADAPLGVPPRRDRTR
jgi:hypothetical protein